MPAHRMNREEFHAQLAGRDADELAKILWTLYWRGSAQMRQRIEAQLDPEAHATQQRRDDEPPDPTIVLDDVRDFADLARSGAYMGGDRRVSPKERTRWRVTFRRLADEAQRALRADEDDAAAAAVELLVDLACEMRDYDYVRSDDPLRAAGVVISDMVAALWRSVRDRHSFAAFAGRAAPQLVRWESPYGWTRRGDGKVAQHETSLARVLEGMLEAPDHWVAVAERYLAALDGLADSADNNTAGRRPRRPASHERRERARALAEWHALLLDRLSGSEDGEALLDRLAAHPALGGPDLTFVGAQLADRRGETEQARTLAAECRKALPGARGIADFAARVGAG